jgi:hypothetical protein
VSDRGPEYRRRAAETPETTRTLSGPLAESVTLDAGAFAGPSSRPATLEHDRAVVDTNHGVAVGNGSRGRVERQRLPAAERATYRVTGSNPGAGLPRVPGAHGRW